MIKQQHPQANQGSPQGQQQGLLQQGQQEKVDPKLQQQFDIFVANGISVIHDEKVSGGLIKRITKSDDPVEAIAKATLDIIGKLEMSAKSSGMDLSDAVLVQGANQLMGEIITLAETAGMQPLTDEQKYQAFSLATSLYLDGAVKSGKISPEELQQMGQDASQTSDGQRILQRLRGSSEVAAEDQPGRDVPGMAEEYAKEMKKSPEDWLANTGGHKR